MKSGDTSVSKNFSSVVGQTGPLTWPGVTSRKRNVWNASSRSSNIKSTCLRFVTEASKLTLANLVKVENSYLPCYPRCCDCFTTSDKLCSTAARRTPDIISENHTGAPVLSSSRVKLTVVDTAGAAHAITTP